MLGQAVVLGVQDPGRHLGVALDELAVEAGGEARGGLQEGEAGRRAVALEVAGVHRPPAVGDEGAQGGMDGVHAQGHGQRGAGAEAGARVGVDVDAGEETGRDGAVEDGAPGRGVEAEEGGGGRPEVGHHAEDVGDHDPRNRDAAPSRRRSSVDRRVTAWRAAASSGGRRRRAARTAGLPARWSPGGAA